MRGDHLLPSNLQPHLFLLRAATLGAHTNHSQQMLRDLETRGEIGGIRGMVEPTSGNTGISLAAMARARGYHVRVVVPNKVPLEKKVLLKIAGADLDVISDELCPAPGLGDGSRPLTW